MDTLTIMLIAMVGYLLVTVANFSDKGMFISLDLKQFGMNGILLALIVGILTGFISFPLFKFFNIKMNKEIPGSFFNKIRITIGALIALLLWWGIGWIINKYVHGVLNDLIDSNFSIYIRNNADQWWGLAIVYGGYALSWFTGIHGPSAWSFLSNPINSANDYYNQQLFLGNIHGSYHIMTWGTDNFIGCFGGTGATFVLPFLLMLFAKNKELKKTGKLSCVSTVFGANEPVLYGTPTILNPYFLVPTIFAPIGNAFLFKTFVQFWGMRGFVTPLNWTIPGPVGIFIGTAFDWKSIILIFIILIFDIILYLPFVKAYDLKLGKKTVSTNQVNNDELEFSKQNFEELKNEFKNKTINLLIICAGGATSGALAEVIKDNALQNGLKMEASGSAWGNHKDLLLKADVVILAPQVANYEDVLKQQINNFGLNTKLLIFKGGDYVRLMKTPLFALENILRTINN